LLMLWRILHYILEFAYWLGGVKDDVRDDSEGLPRLLRITLFYCKNFDKDYFLIFYESFIH
jgi:hypothetical protein